MNPLTERAVAELSAMDRRMEELTAALRWCLDEGLDEYVRETELQRLAEYRVLLLAPLPSPTKGSIR